MERVDEDAQLVVNSLREAGVVVSDIYEFVNGRTPHEAIPVLIALLPLLGDNAVKEGVVRALADRNARGLATQALVSELRKSDSSNSLMAWTIANSLAEIADETVYDELKDLVRDRSLGKAREMLVIAIARTKHPAAIADLSDLCEDETLTGPLVRGLGQLRATELKPFVEKQLQHPQPWVRREAKKALSPMR